MTALTREPSGSRASQSGEVSSTRRPTRLTIRRTISMRCFSSLKTTSDRDQPPATLDVDALRPVDQDVGDRRVAHQDFERADAEGLVEHLADQLLALGQAEQVVALAAELLGPSADLLAQFVLAHRADRREIHLGDQLGVQSVLIRSRRSSSPPPNRAGSRSMPKLMRVIASPPSGRISWSMQKKILSRRIGEARVVEDRVIAGRDGRPARLAGGCALRRSARASPRPGQVGRLGRGRSPSAGRPWRRRLGRFVPITSTPDSSGCP